MYTYVHIYMYIQYVPGLYIQLSTSGLYGYSYIYSLYYAREDYPIARSRATYHVYLRIYMHPVLVLFNLQLYIYIYAHKN